VSFDPEDLPSTLSLRTKCRIEGNPFPSTLRSSFDTESSFDPEVSGPKGRTKCRTEGQDESVTNREPVVRRFDFAHRPEPVEGQAHHPEQNRGAEGSNPAAVTAPPKAGVA